MSPRPAVGPNQAPIQWVPGALSPGVKRPGREADQSPPTSAEVNKNGSTRVHPLLHTPLQKGKYMIEDSNNTPKTLPQHLHIALTAVATVHIGKSKKKK
jgi:hypothetical protein